MNILKTLKILKNYYEQNRQRGHTTLMVNGLNTAGEKCVLVHSSAMSSLINKMAHNEITSIVLTSGNLEHKLNQTNLAPLAIDNAALWVLIYESIKEIERLMDANAK